MTKNKKCWFCGAEKKVSKKGNLYCPNICWEKKEYKEEFERSKLLYEAIMESEHGDWGDRDCDATESDIY